MACRPSRSSPPDRRPTTRTFGSCSFRIAPGSRDRAAGPDAADERGEPTLGLLPDLGPGRLVMGLGVHGVVVLVRLEGTRDLRGQSVGDAVVALRRVRGDGRRADHDLRPVRAEQRDLLLAHLVRHHEDAPIAADRSGDRQTVAGVAGGRLDDRPSGLQQPFALGRLDHPEPDAILHRAARVQHLQLREDRGLDAPGHGSQAHQRRVAHRIEERIEHRHGVPFVSAFLAHGGPPHRATRGPERPKVTYPVGSTSGGRVPMSRR